MSKVEQKAIELYLKYMKLDSEIHTFMWKQCSEKYRNAWRLIASVDLGTEDNL